MNVRLAGPDDAGAIAKLMRDSFEPAVLAMTIYGCEGIAHYLEDRLRLQRQLSDCRHLLAFAGPHPAGFVELRLMPEAVCINYIALAPAWRGMGNADRLLARALETVDGDGQGSVILDVFASNAVSGSWYRALGFEAERETAWWSLPMAGGRVGEARCIVDGLPEADVCHRAYGFSRFILSTRRANYRVGRLGARWFKTLDPGLQEDEDAIVSLALLDPARKLLGLFPCGLAPRIRHDAEHLDTSVRMRVSLQSLRARLARRTGA